jgi:hypothetical protein
VPLVVQGDSIASARKRARLPAGATALGACWSCANRPSASGCATLAATAPGPGSGLPGLSESSHAPRPFRPSDHCPSATEAVVSAAGPDDSFSRNAIAVVEAAVENGRSCLCSIGRDVWPLREPGPTSGRHAATRSSAGRHCEMVRLRFTAADRYDRSGEDRGRIVAKPRMAGRTGGHTVGDTRVIPRQSQLMARRSTSDHRSSTLMLRSRMQRR